MSDKKDRPSHETGSWRIETDVGDARGQIDPRTLLWFIVGGTVLAIIAGPLAAAAIDIQSSLAATPAFSGFTAAVIAVLIVATVVAAILTPE